jgi:uncharacterized coiled-coil DUF342 family protein
MGRLLSILTGFIPPWLPLAAIAVLTGALGMQTVRLSWAKAELATYRMEVAENTAKAEAAARATERAWQKQNERVAKDAIEKQTELAKRAADAALAADSLRDQIDRLNARPSPADPAATAFANEARAARELLGRCAKAYRGLAERADEYRNQVMGLQDYAHGITGE